MTKYLQPLTIVALVGYILGQAYQLHETNALLAVAVKDFQEEKGFYDDANKLAMDCLNKPEELGR